MHASAVAQQVYKFAWTKVQDELLFFANANKIMKKNSTESDLRPLRSIQTDTFHYCSKETVSEWLFCFAHQMVVEFLFFGCTHIYAALKQQTDKYTCTLAPNVNEHVRVCVEYTLHVCAVCGIRKSRTVRVCTYAVCVRLEIIHWTDRTLLYMCCCCCCPHIIPVPEWCSWECLYCNTICVQVLSFVIQTVPESLLLCPMDTVHTKQNVFFFRK